MGKIKVQNQENMVTRTIEQAPPSMMFREFFQNAIEAVTSPDASSTSVPQILIDSIDPAIFGYDPDNFGFSYNSPKLMFWNNRKGLSAKQLREAVNMSSSIDKKQGTLDNYGIGAKATSLGVNKSGLIWVSCKDQKVHTTLLYRKETRPDVYEYCCHDFVDSLDKSTTIPQMTDVFDITELAENNFLPWSNSEDWTAIILCGNDPDQNTVTHPLDASLAPQPSFIINNLYRRYFRTPEGIDARLRVGYNRNTSNVKFVPVHEYITALAKSNPETVQHEMIPVSDTNAVNIWYVYDGPSNKGGKNNEDRPLSTYSNIATVASFSSLVYKDEMYDVSTSDNRWKGIAGQIGILREARYFRVFVELSDKGDILPDQYRQNLMKKDNDKTIVKLDDYVNLIRDNMPDWFREKIKEHSPSDLDMQDIDARALRFLEKILKDRDTRVSLFENPDGHVDANIIPASKNPVPRENKDDDANSPPNTSGPRKAGPNGSGRNVKLKNLPGGKKFTVNHDVPPVVFLRTDDDIKKSSATNIINRAAEYAESSAIYINCTYPVVNRVINSLMIDYQSKKYSSLVDKIKDKAYDIVNSHLAWIVQRAICLMYVKKSDASYTKAHIDNALSAESLTCHADNIEYQTEFEHCKELLRLSVKVMVPLNSDTDIQEDNSTTMSSFFDVEENHTQGDTNIVPFEKNEVAS